MPEESVTELLHRVTAGDKSAENRLMARVYPDLHAMARGHFRRENPGHTLQPTALVNEIYLKVVADGKNQWKNRSHFFAIASRAMQQVLTDHARRERADKRGGGAPHVSIELANGGVDSKFVDLLIFDQALKELNEVNPRLAEVVIYRYFGDMKEEEIAEAQGVSTRTVRRDWEFARAWLRDWMTK